MKAAGTQRGQKLLTDETRPRALTPPPSLHRRSRRGGKKRKRRASGASYQWRLAPQREWRHPKVYKGVRRPAPAPPSPVTQRRPVATVLMSRMTTRSCGTSSFPPRHGEFLQPREEARTRPGPTSLGRHHQWVPQTQRLGPGLHSAELPRGHNTGPGVCTAAAVAEAASRQVHLATSLAGVK